MKEASIHDLMSMQDILKMAIEREEEARDFYLQAMERVSADTITFYGDAENDNTNAGMLLDLMA